jgi:acyl carrier protein
MTSSGILPNPFSVVAQALQCSHDSLSIESEMYRDHGWDSFGHVSIIKELEKAYGISITNDEMMSLTTMRAIVELSQRSREVDQHGG